MVVCLGNTASMDVQFLVSNKYNSYIVNAAELINRIFEGKERLCVLFIDS